MAIYKGNKKVVAVYKGSTPINKIYKGVTLVFQKSGGGGGSTHLFEGTATDIFYLRINDNSILITPEADGKWFYDTDEKITSLSSAFYNVTVVTSVVSNLDLTGISTNSMFEGDSNITSIKFNNTKSMKPTTVSKMFSGCISLVSLDLSNFDMSNISKPWFAANIFENCTSLSTIKCTQAFKDWCINRQDAIALPTAMREGGSGTWEIVG